MAVHGRTVCRACEDFQDRPWFSEAWGKFRRITLRLPREHFLCVYAVCLVGEPVEHWAASKGAPGQLGLIFLQDALDALGEVMRRSARHQ